MLICWQIPLTEQAKEIPAFVTPDGLYQYKVMPFGMKNAPATFQRMVNYLITDLEGCKAYIDDVLIYSDNHTCCETDSNKPVVSSFVAGLFKTRGKFIKQIGR